MVALFTSIPPRITRHDRSGADVGERYLRRCIESWLAAGHRVVSVNGEEESAQIRALFPDVDCRITERTAEATLGRPLIHVSDLLAECAAEPDPVVGIVNADLLLHDPSAFATALAALDGTTMLCGPRLDVDDPDDASRAEPYLWGVDYFFFAPSAAAGIADEGFVFGAAWWDFWLPLVLAKRGCRIVYGETAFARHLAHPDNYHMPSWLGFLQAFARSVSVRLPLPGDGGRIAQANQCFAVFLRHFKPQAQAPEQFGFGLYVSLVVLCFLRGEPALADAVRRRWLELLPQAPDHAAHVVFAPLLESLDEVRRRVAAPGT